MANVIDVLVVGILGVPKRCASKTHSGFVRNSIHASASTCVRPHTQSRRLELKLNNTHNYERTVTRDA